MGMKRLLVLGLPTLVSAAVIAGGLAAPAHADPTGADAAFLASLDSAGVSHSGGSSQTVAAGHAVCALMDGGFTPVDTVNAVRSTNPGFTMQYAVVFANLAAAAYCPEHL